MTGLPKSWADPSIGEVTEVNPRKSVSVSGDDLVTFVPMAAVDEVSGTILTPIERPYREVSKGFTHFTDGDVIFAKITPSMENGKSAVARRLRNGVGVGSTEFHVFRSHGAIEPEYLWYFVRQQRFRDDAQAVMSGAVGQQRVPTDYLKSHTIPLPPLPEQRRIVAKIDGLTARTARARADLDRIPTLIARYKQRLLALALCGGLTADWRNTYGSNGWVEKGIRQLSERRETYEKSKRGSRLRSTPPLEKGPTAGLPSSWISCCLADVADLRVGYAFKSDWFSSEGVRLVRGANVAPGRLDWSDERRLSPEHVPSFSEYSLEAGDVVIAMDRPLISTGLKIAIVEEQDAGALLVQRVANPRPTEWLHPLFMYHVFCGREFISQVESHATGSDLPHISGNDILTTRVPLPPIEEQVEIVNRIKSAFDWLERMAADHAAATKLLPKFDAAILAKAFRGELVPQDPNDEPASSLLARIKGANAYSDAKTATRANRVRRLEKTKSDAPMNKTRNDSNVRGKPYLTAILRERKAPITPNELHSLSGLPLHEFYHQLAQEYDEGWLREVDGRVGVA